MAQIRRSAQEWGRIISEYENSGQKRSVWCKANGYNEGTFNTAFRRVKAKKEDNTASITWACIKTVSNSDVCSKSSSKLEIEYHGLLITAYSDYPTSGLAALCAELMRIC